jgi:hypothetical protein
MKRQRPSSRPARRSRPRIVRRRARARTAGILGLLFTLSSLALRRTLAARLAALAALSLLGQVEPLKLGQFHARQPDGALEVLAMLVGRDRVAARLGLFGH